MTEAKQPLKQEHPLAKRLHQAGITKVAIIDDAYDPLNVDALQIEIEDFWNEIESKHNKDIIDELNSFGFKFKSPDEINDDVLEKLWSLRANMKAIRSVCDEKLFSKRIEMRDELDLFCDHLNYLGLDIVTLGVVDDLPDPSIKLIFLDYVLDPTVIKDILKVIKDHDKHNNLGKLAKDRAVSIYHNAKKTGEDKPFIVLMSSKKGIDALKDDFQNASKLLGALFGFMPKEDMCNREKLFLRLGSWGIGSPTHHEIQRFVDATVESVDSVLKEFSKIIRKLDIQDYTFIQRLSLHEDGHPLGDYILWLFESTLSYIFRNNKDVRQKQGNLDKLKFKKFLPCQNQPSIQLARIYRYAVTEPTVEALEAHPHDESNILPLLKLGYIFIKDKGTDLLMVINAACDLSFAPEASRQLSPEQPIYLIPGSLVQLHQRDYDPELIRTELFEYKGNVYRIIWNHKRAIPIEYKNVWSCLSDNGYILKARLRLPYALQVQQKFAAHLVRIGMPVPPPIYDSADIEVYCKGVDGKYSLLGKTIVDGVVIIHGKDADHFILTVECVNDILDKLDEIVQHIKSQKDLLNKQDTYYEEKAKSMIKQANKLLEAKEDSESWLKIVENPEPLPKAGKKKELHANLIWLYRDGDFEAEYKPKIPIVLNIKYGEKPTNLETPGGDPAHKNEEGLPSESSGMDQKNYGIMKKCRQWIDQNISRVKGWFQNLVCNV